METYRSGERADVSSNILAVAWMAFAAFAATDWIGLPGGRGDVRLLLFVVLTASIALDAALHRQAQVSRPLALTIGLGALGAVVFFVADLHHDPGYFDRGEVVTLLRFLVTAALAGVGANRLAKSRARRLLWPAGLVALAVFTLTLMVPLVADGVNPLAKTLDAASGNPDALIVDVFYAAYESAGVDFEGLGPAFRHETVRIIVLAWAFGLVSVRPGDQRRISWSRHAGTAGVWALAALALSRFTLVALGIVAVLVVARAIRSGRISRRQAQAGAIGAVALVVIVLIVAGDLIIGRITDSDTDSAEIRVENLEQAIETIPDGALVGVANDTLTCAPGVICSPHFLPLDWWLGGGVLGAVASLGIWGLLGIGAVRTGRRYWRSNPDQESDGIALGAFVLFVMLFINWASTGGGLLSLGLWFGLGAAFGLSQALEEFR